MGNSLVRTVLPWVAVALVALVVLKFAFAAIAGLVQLVLALVVLAAVGYAVLWAVRRL